MSIIRITKKENPFVMIDRRVLEDARLTWRAKGIISYLLSKPDKWEVQVRDIWGKGIEGRNAVQAALLELQEIGYAKLTTIKGEFGKLGGSRWDIFEEPIGGFLDATDKPKTGAPTNRKSGSRRLSNKEDSLTENQSKNEQQQDESEIAAAAADLLIKSTTGIEGVTLVEKYAVEAEKKESPNVALKGSLPPRPTPGESAPRRFDAFDIDIAAVELKENEFSAENFARITGTPAAQMVSRFTAEVDVFVLEQKGKKTPYNRFDEFSSHFFNYERAKVRAGRNGASPTTTFSQSGKANLNRLGGDAEAYQEKPLF